MLDILNRHSEARFHLSPLYLAIVAFCFSMTVGVIWEFFECTMDQLFFLDMQKDTVTVRDRDTMQQIRLPIDQLVPYIEKKIEF